MPQTCIQCSTYHPTYTLPYTIYGSTQVLKLFTCHHCHLPVDRYSEYELQLKVIDLVLCRLSVYRHWLVNTSDAVTQRMAKRLFFGLVPLYALCIAWVQHQRALAVDALLPWELDTTKAQLNTALPATIHQAVDPSLHLPLLSLTSALTRLLVSGVVYTLCISALTRTTTVRHCLQALQLSLWPALLYAIFYIYNYHTTYTLAPPLMILCNRVAATNVLLQTSIQQQLQQQRTQNDATSSNGEKQYVLPASQWYAAVIAVVITVLSWGASLLASAWLVAVCSSLTHTQSMLVAV